ncbi:MAG: bifunctional phosphoribosyl-AMP cyclohydrolase/phosphoribosyl-ATP diphosphatase HisIE [Erysipelotrichaceae bacterium]|nr:bifunctional phosphoribosyl-AMP cyclohydrolase/phosphoribosyl-ATP diphosphatase HisIE [Erysipelotrichaceae bacterium]
MRPDFEKGNGLVPAIVQDYQTKQVLMLAYVNEEAYDKMLETKETYYWSRSRQELWHKGETSGHFQYIKGMYLDCDVDTLLIYVEQIGAACHTGSYSCFFNEILPYKFNDTIFHELYDVIKDRDIHPIEKSYTNYLLNEGVDKICKKVGEEASETIIAAKNDNKDELIGEISDLFYHVFVLMYNQGVTVEDIENKLAQRHRISGNKKDFHTRGDY